jgi:phosphatidate cytidylyltransferase
VTVTTSDQPGGGVPRAGAKGRSDLALRFVSALALAPLALGAAYLGGWPFVLFWLLAATAVLWEWNTLAAPSSVRPVLAVGVGPLLLAAVLAGIGRTTTPILLILIGAVGAAAFAPVDRRGWTAGGVIYAGALLLAPIFLRREPEFGFLAIVYLFAIVWTTDTAAYFVGRALGGPKLWPQISPKKTWSGAIGGTVAATALAAALINGATSAPFLPLVVVGVVLSAVSQAGDLLESAVKRHFGAKDASQLIPGHGGVMDRLDGFLTAAASAALIGILHQGTDAAARGLLLW